MVSKVDLVIDCCDIILETLPKIASGEVQDEETISLLTTCYQNITQSIGGDVANDDVLKKSIYSKKLFTVLADTIKYKNFNNFLAESIQERNATDIQEKMKALIEKMQAFIKEYTKTLKTCSKCGKKKGILISI